MMRNLVLASVLGIALFPALQTAGAQGVGLRIGHRNGSTGVGLRVDLPIGGHRHTSCCRSFVPGHWKTVCERVFVPGRVERVWCPPVYRWRRVGCRRVRVCVRPGRWDVRREPGCWRSVERRVWIPGRWAYTCGH